MNIEVLMFNSNRGRVKEVTTGHYYQTLSKRENGEGTLEGNRKGSTQRLLKKAEKGSGKKKEPYLSNRGWEKEIKGGV